jgi:curli biogenesis system outer membrane secretion channel CsgG
MRVLALVLLLTSICIGQSTESGSAPNPPAQAATPAASDKPAVTNLSLVKRIYVSSFGDDEVSKQLQAMVVSSLVASKKFVVTENEKKADGVLKGAALQKTSQEVHAYGSGTSVGAAAGGHQSSVSGSSVNGNGSISGSSSGGFAAKHMGIDDSSVNTETIDRASAAVRLVNSDGDVIWSTTQESHGAKYKGATADVADKIVSQLTRDVEKASKPNSAQN